LKPDLAGYEASMFVLERGVLPNADEFYLNNISSPQFCYNNSNIHTDDDSGVHTRSHQNNT